MTQRLGRGPIVATFSAASTIEAERQVTVHAESTGRILQLSAEEGQRVRKGELLALVRHDAQDSGLARAETNLEKNQGEYERLRRLFDQKVVSQQEIDSARIAFETSRIDVDDRRRDLRNTKVIAPIDGTITQRSVSAGAFVTSGAQVLSIVDFSTLVARVYVPERELDRLHVGQPAEIVGKAAQGRRGTGAVARIAPIVDSTTGTVKVTISLPPELAGGPKGFLPGMYAEVTLTTERRDDVLLVQKSAVAHDDDQSWLFVVEGNRVRRKPVKLGLANREQAEVLEGAAVGDEIVLVGQAGLRDGALVRRVDASGKPLEPDPTAGAVAEGAVAAATTPAAAPSGAP
jgi:membrane fusion protein (multidrug efflux system)